MIKSVRQLEKLLTLSNEDENEKIFDKEDLVFCKISKVSEDIPNEFKYSSVAYVYLLKVYNRSTHSYFYYSPTKSKFFKKFEESNRDRDIQYIIKTLTPKLDEEKLSLKDIATAERYYKRKKEMAKEK